MDIYLWSFQQETITGATIKLRGHKHGAYVLSSAVGDYLEGHLCNERLGLGLGHTKIIAASCCYNRHHVGRLSRAQSFLSLTARQLTLVIGQ
jgi:hypothetical protein